MSVIRNLLYGGSSFDAINSGILYNQTLLHNFITQHQPKFILHCGNPENALDLAYFVRQHHQCEILHVKNWNPSTSQWLSASGTPPNPHKIFLDKIAENNLEDYLVSFDGFSETAFEVLNYRNFRFHMMISDNIGEATDYLPLLSLLHKNALHIRYIGNKKLNEIKDEPIFNADVEASLTYAQGFLITGMDYLSLYEENQTPEDKTDNYNLEPFKNFDEHFTETQKDAAYYSKMFMEQEAIKQSLETENKENNSATEEEAELTPEEQERAQEREEYLKLRSQKRAEREKRRQERLERRKRQHNLQSNETTTDENNDEDIDNTDNDTADNTDLATIPPAPLPRIKDDGSDVISTARQALRQKRLERRKKRLQRNTDSNN